MLRLTLHVKSATSKAPRRNAVITSTYPKHNAKARGGSYSPSTPRWPRRSTTGADRGDTFRCGTSWPKNMRRLRAAHGLSPEALAHECGMGRTYLSGVGRSDRNVSIDNIGRIARGLHIEP
jgi:Helix-turn-helix